MGKLRIKNWKVNAFIAIVAVIIIAFHIIMISHRGHIWVGYISFAFVCVFLYLLIKQKIKLDYTKMAYNQKKDLLNDILAYTPDLIYYKNLKSEILGCNDKFCEFFELTESEIIGNTLFKFFSEGDSQRILEKEAFVIKNKKSIQYELLLHKGKEKEERYLNVTKTPIYDDKNNVVGLLSICRDITDFKNREQEKINFNAALTHDLKTPIIAQIKALEILEANQLGELNEEQKTLIQQTIYSAKLVQEMLNSILYISKFELNSYKFNPEDFDIRETIEYNIEKMQSIAENKNLTLSIDYSQFANGTINADKFLIQRAIGNLILNSITCSKENSSLNIILSNIKDNLKFSVQSKTIKSNMTKEKIERLFEKYVLTKEKFRQIGTGLGMHLAKEIITNHDGKIYGDIIKMPNKDYDIYEFGFELKTIPQNSKDQKELIAS